MTARLVISEHDQLGGLGDDDHVQYLLLAGRAGGQTAIGGTLTTETLVLQDNVVDANQFTLGPGLVNGLLDGQAGQHDFQCRHIGVGVNAAGNGHLILGGEFFTGTGNKVGVGMFPAYISSGTGNLYGVQGNVFFGGSLWGVGSNINALQFYPAPDYLNGATSWGNANLNLIGITTGGCINIFTRTINCNALLGISVTTLAAIFGGPGSVSANRATAIEVTTPVATTGIIAVQTGIEIQPQLHGTVNQGLWMGGDGAGSDIVLGAGKDARIFYDGTNLIIDPDNVGTGRVYIGVTGDDDLLVNNLYVQEYIYHEGDADTYIRFTGDQIDAVAGNAAMLRLAETDVQDFVSINPTSADIDFRVQGDTGRVIDVDAAIDGLGFYGATPVAKSATYTPTNVTTDRSYDADSTSIDEVADVLGTLIADLKAVGIIG